jgi:predicted nuclease of predicted toxin-antitoxin system
MNLLLDSCVWGGAQAELVAAGHDVTWVGDWPGDPGDEAILARAHAERRILVTLDKDFGELAVAAGLPHAGIIRLVDIVPRRQAAVCVQVLAQHGPDLQAGAIITAQLRRIRLRPPESGNGGP